MRITVNNNEVEIEETTTAIDLLLQMGYKKHAASVWVNGKQLLLAQYESYTFNEGDTVKLIRILGGGV